MEDEKKKESFYEFWQINDREKEFFEMIYRREVAYRWVITFLLFTVIVLTVLLFLV